MAYYSTTQLLGKPGQWIENWHQMNFLATILHHSQLRHSNQENFLTIAGESASKTMVTVLAPMTKVAMMWNHHISTWWYFLLVASKEKYGVMNVGFFKWWKAMLTQKHWSNVHFFQGKKTSKKPLSFVFNVEKDLQLPANQALTPPPNNPWTRIAARSTKQKHDFFSSGVSNSFFEIATWNE